MSTHAHANHTINVTTIVAAQSTFTRSLVLIATDLAHAGGLHPGSPQSTASGLQRCTGQGGFPRPR